MIYSSSQRKLVLLPAGAVGFLLRRVEEAAGLVLMIFACALILAYLSYAPSDPSPLRASAGPHRNLLGGFGSAVSDVGLQTLGAAYLLLIATLLFWGWRMFACHGLTRAWLRITLLPVMLIFAALAFSALPGDGVFAPAGVGGAIGRITLHALMPLTGNAHGATAIAGAVLASVSGIFALGFDPREWKRTLHKLTRLAERIGTRPAQLASKPGFIRSKLFFSRLARHSADRRASAEREQLEPVLCRESSAIADDAVAGPALPSLPPAPHEPGRELRAWPPPAPDVAMPTPAQDPLVLARQNDYHLPSSDLLAPPAQRKEGADPAALQEQARLLEAVLQDFGVHGRIVNVRSGPAVTIHELDPAPGTKSSRVIGLADDIARSLSVVAVRIAVVPGRGAIGIELPNALRQTVMLREVLENDVFERTAARLALVLGVDIGGNPVVEDLARMPHLLIAGATGSGKSVGINTMILSLLYRLPPERCRFIMIDPKMLELSVYDGIPHLLTPVVTEPRKAVVALKWAVKEMENRYRGMAQLGVRNIESYNAKVAEIARSGAGGARRVHVGFDEATGRPLYEDQLLALHHLPYIVVVVDEMADLMMVAGKEIEAAIQRLAQMARAAGIHLIMATQRPSVDVITGTIKANFPSRVSFRVTSKIDSRTILGEAGAEQLLGQGDMLVMLSGGRVDRVHGPFVTDCEVEAVVSFLKRQGTPAYLDAITEDENLSSERASESGGPVAIKDEDDDLYDQAVALVARERKASTSFIQRHLQIGYNRAARLVERMEAEGAVGAANHVGKREVLIARQL